MPTKRQRISRGRRRATSPTAWAWLTDAPMPEDADQWELLDLQHPTSARLLDSCRALWEQHRNEILAAWVKEKPGTRPARWWEFDAPPGC